MPTQAKYAIKVDAYGYLSSHDWSIGDVAYCDFSRNELFATLYETEEGATFIASMTNVERLDGFRVVRLFLLPDYWPEPKLDG